MSKRVPSFTYCSCQIHFLNTFNAVFLLVTVVFQAFLYATAFMHACGNAASSLEITMR